MKRTFFTGKAGVTLGVTPPFLVPGRKVLDVDFFDCVFLGGVFELNQTGLPIQNDKDRNKTLLYPFNFRPRKTQTLAVA